LVFDDVASEQHIRREREAARLMRKSRWWQTAIAKARCYYCAEALEKSGATMDHIVPIARGGRSTPGNVVVACKSCNTQKRDLTAADWLLYMDSLKSHSPLTGD